MKRIFTTLLALWSVTTMAGLPPTTLSGEASATKPTTFAFKTPNYQATQISGIQSRIETGNKNLLQNPSFEHSTASTGWTCSNATMAASTTGLHDGVKSLAITSTGTNWYCYQDVTLYAAAKSGTDAETSIVAQTSATDVWSCPRVNGANPAALSVANSCVQYVNGGVAQKLPTYPLYGSTSTGIMIGGATSGVTVYVDDAYLGDRRPMAAGPTTTPSKTYNGTFTNMGTITPSTNNCKYSRTGNLMHADCYFQAGTMSTALGGPVIPDSLNIDSSKIVNTNNTSSVGQIVGRFSGNVAGQNGFILASPGTSTTQLYLGATSASTAITPTNLTSILTNNSNVSLSFDVPILEWSSASNAFTTKCDDPRQCETDLSAQVTSTSGTISQQSTGSTYTWLSSCTAANPTVCTFNTALNLAVAPNCQAVIANNGSAGYLATVQSTSSTTVNIVTTNASSGANVASLPFILTCKKQGADYTASKLTQQIVQMRGVPVVPGGERVDTFSFDYGTGSAGTVCSASPCSYLNQIGSGLSSISRVSGGQYTLNFSKTYTKVMCQGAGTAGAGIIYDRMSCSSCSTLTMITRNSASFAALDSAGNVQCQGSY